MSNTQTTTTVFDRIRSTLAAHNAVHEVIEHAPEGRTELISRIRGNPVKQAAKAMAVRVKTVNGSAIALVVVPGDRRVDLQAVSRVLNGHGATLAPIDVAASLTECAIGSIPPFIFNSALRLVVDERLLAEPHIYFNAGRLDRSIKVETDGYKRAAEPIVANVSM